MIKCPMCEHVFDNGEESIKYNLWKLEEEVNNLIEHLKEFHKLIEKESEKNEM